MSQGTVVCDLDGVVYLGDVAIPGAGQALRTLEDAGYGLLFATNNSSKTVLQVAEKIRRLSGYRPRSRQIVGSAEAAAALLAPSRPLTLPVGGEGILEALSSYEIDTTDDPLRAAAVVMGLRMDLTYRDLANASVAVRNGARFVATNADPTFPTPRGLVPGAGALVAAVETASGVDAEVAGKPHEAIRRLLSDRLSSEPVWVVGDRPETDMAMAYAEGWIPVLVLGGVTARESEVSTDLAPDLVVSSLAELPARLLAG